MPEVTGSSPVSSTIMKVSVFIDGQNFYRSLQRFDDSLRVDYDRLASWITQTVGGPAAIFAGACHYVGGSAGPAPPPPRRRRPPAPRARPPGARPGARAPARAARAPGARGGGAGGALAPD